MPPPHKSSSGSSKPSLFSPKPAQNPKHNPFTLTPGQKRDRNGKTLPTPETPHQKNPTEKSSSGGAIAGRKVDPEAPSKLLNGDHKKEQGQKNRVKRSEQRQRIFEARKRLPIWARSNEIRQSLRGNKDVLLLVGETGSGKSTQVPQFLAAEPWCTKCIAITQPRRVAAISLARRVAEEMGTPLGSASPASKVGYSVRFDTSVSPSTKIKFLTEGMLLQEMLRDPSLSQYSAVIVDEVHERSVNVDLIMGFLRNVLSGVEKSRKGDKLKVVVMSATADVESLFKFFSAGYKSTQHLSNGTAVTDTESSWSGISTSEDDKAVFKSKKDSKANGMAIVHPNEQEKTRTISVTDLSTDRITTCYIEGRQFPVKIMYLPEPTTDFVEAALKSVFQIHYKEPLPGDLLVFLTGQDTVEALERLINEYAAGMGPEVPKLLCLPLFAALPQSAQQRVFQPRPPNTRKVILSTNIAETSVTVPGIRFVIDSGKHKLKQFRNRLGLDSLLVKPVSQSSAIQRSGRAGREAPGQCYRLYTEKDFLGLDKRTAPEILRTDLASAVLTMKARGVDDVINFPFLDPPPRDSLEKALLQLLQLNALNEDGSISETGRNIAKLPLSASLGRVLIAAAEPENDCLLDAIDIISCLSVENIYLHLVTEERKEEAEQARRELYRREGDHLTQLATVQGYAAENADRKAWAERHFVSHRAMQNVMVSFSFLSFHQKSHNSICTKRVKIQSKAHQLTISSQITRTSANNSAPNANK